MNLAWAEVAKRTWRYLFLSLSLKLKTRQKNKDDDLLVIIAYAEIVVRYCLPIGICNQRPLSLHNCCEVHNTSFSSVLMNIKGQIFFDAYTWWNIVFYNSLKVNLVRDLPVMYLWRTANLTFKNSLKLFVVPT